MRGGGWLVMATELQLCVVGPMIRVFNVLTWIQLIGG